MLKKNKGFTLIELLVVIAIIGILASVVLASLNTAREKANQASIQANLKTISVQAELYYDDHDQSYGTAKAATNVCTADMFSDDTIAQAVTTAVAAGTAASQLCAIGTNGQNWALSVQYKAGTTGSDIWCTDSTGYAGVSKATVTVTAGVASCL